MIKVAHTAVGFFLLLTSLSVASSSNENPIGYWQLAEDKNEVELFLTSDTDKTSVIYQICHRGGPFVRVFAGAVTKSKELSIGRCLDVRTAGSVTIVRANPSTSSQPAYGTYQLLSTR